MRRKKSRRRKHFKSYSTKEINIQKIGLRKYLGKRKGYKRIKGKTAVDIKMTVYDQKGKKIREIKGRRSMGLSRMRRNWQKEIGSYVHGQLKEYSLYIGNYFTPKQARKFRYYKARKVTVALKFKKI